MDRKYLTNRQVWGKILERRMIISVEIYTVHLKVYNDVIFLRKIT
jgi:hypothetical protein